MTISKRRLKPNTERRPLSPAFVCNHFLAFHALTGVGTTWQFPVIRWLWVYNLTREPKTCELCLLSIKRENIKPNDELTRKWVFNTNKQTNKTHFIYYTTYIRITNSTGFHFSKYTFFWHSIVLRFKISTLGYNALVSCENEG